MLEAYSFVPDTSTAVRFNAQHIRGDMSSAQYFTNPSNITFHDLTRDKSVPPANVEIMGLKKIYFAP